MYKAEWISSRVLEKKYNPILNTKNPRCRWEYMIYPCEKFLSNTWWYMFKSQIGLSPITGQNGLPSGSAVKNPPAVEELQQTQVWSLGQEDPLEKSMATHSSILAWEVLQSEEPGGPQSDLQSQTRLKQLGNGNSSSYNSRRFASLSLCYEQLVVSITLLLAHRRLW